MKEYPFPSLFSPNGLYLYAPGYDRERCVVKEAELLQIPMKPVWCGSCNRASFAEDLRTIRDWEGAFASIRSGMPVEFPIDTAGMSESSEIVEEFRKLFDIRLKRQDAGRCLLCGGMQYIVVGTPNTGIRHEGCNGEFVRMYLVGSAVYKMEAHRIYSADGFQVGRLDKRLTDGGNEISVDNCGYGEMA